ncbi:MAG TPA: DNA/RNA non-specific endonuclease, partial [Verrucomicrobiae bacterium]|nr:DNA/RNA non-specific endonuclease [Verrucomicrobiae bacterium]
VESIDYDDDLGEPNWVSWDLTAGDIGSSGRSPDFFTDTTLPSGFYQVLPGDYSGSGFDRGHMCPSADRTDNTTDNDLVFYMSNIIPQAPDNNQGVWADFESYCRSLAQGGNELLIICGPSGFTGSRILPSLAAAIPAYTWKIVVVVPPGAGTALSRITGATRTIALKIPNTNGVSSVWQNFVTSASQIEVDTGFSFFTSLPPEIASSLRSKVDGQNNLAPVITGFSPSTGAVNGIVVVTGTNFSSAASVTFNGVSGQFSLDSQTQISAVVPTNATTGTISVTTPGGTAISSNSFVVTNSAADLAIALAHTGNFAQGDSSDTYTITIRNVGTSTSSGEITVSEILPAGLTATAMNGFGWTADLQTLTCTRSDALAGGASYPAITATVAVSSNAPSTVTNITTVSGGSDANPDNNYADDLTIINAAGDVGQTVTLLGWDVRSLSGGSGNYGISPLPPAIIAPNIISSGLVRGSGVGTSGTAAARAWGGNAFTASSSSAAVSANQIITVSTVVNTGYTVSYTSIPRFDYRRSSTGPATGVLQYQVGLGSFNDVTALAYPANTSSGGSLAPINLSGISDLQHVGAGTNVTFRIVNYGGGSAGTWYVFDVAGTPAPDLVLQGIVSPVLILTPVESWRMQWFGTTNNSSTAADSAVITSDGIPNLVKYAFGLDPLVPAQSPVVCDISTGWLRLSAPKNPNATDITYIVESTDNPGSPWTTNGVVKDQDTATFLQVHSEPAVASSTSRFMRLRITRH